MMYRWRGLDRLENPFLVASQPKYPLILTQEWFRSLFTNATSIETATVNQANFWKDAMGGGKSYQGGYHRLRFKHAELGHKASLRCRMQRIAFFSPYVMRQSWEAALDLLATRRR